MKTIPFLLLLFMFTVEASAQVNKSDSALNHHQIFIDAKGGIHGHGGTKLGYIDKGNIVRNNMGKKLYFIDRNGNVIDANGKNLGKARKDGSYYNAAGENIITVKDKDAQTCEILDPKGHSMGTVHKNYKMHACASHCFFMQQERLKHTKPAPKPSKSKG